MSAGIQLLSLEPNKDVPTEIRRRKEIVTHTDPHFAKVALMKLFRNYYDRYDQFSYYIGVTINPLSRRSSHKRKPFSLSIDDHPDQAIHFGLQPNQDDLVIEQLKSETVKLQFKGHQLWDRMCIFFETSHLEDIKQFESDAISYLLIYSDLAYPDATNANAIDSGYAKNASSYFAYALLGERFERHNAYLDKQRKFIEDLSRTESQMAIREVLMRRVLASDNSSGLIKLVKDMIQDTKLPSGSRHNLSLALQNMMDSLRSLGDESS